MDKNEKKYNWKDAKSKLNEFDPKDSLWDAISDSLDNPEPEFDFYALKDKLPDHTPSDNIWNNIQSDLDKPVPQFDFEKLKDKLPVYTPNDQVWSKIQSGVDNPAPLFDFNKLKNELPGYTPADQVWDDIQSDLDKPDPQFDFDKLKDKLPVHIPTDNIWEGISEQLDKPEIPKPVFIFDDIKSQLTEFTPSESIWENIEDGLELDQRIEGLPSHEPPVNLWDKIEEDLEDVKGGVSFLRIAIMFGFSMLIILGAAVMLNQDETILEPKVQTDVETSTMQFASNENYNIEWSDDEDVRLIQEMCKDYMAVCEQPKFKELESELLELNDHKKELLDMVSAFDEESSYGSMLAKIETQKTELMKEMIAMI